MKIDIEIQHVETLTEFYPIMLPQDADYPLLATVLQQGQCRVQKRHFIRRYWAAAVVLLSIGASIYYWQQDVATSRIIASHAKATIPLDITPGRQGAILTLADGSRVLLDSLSDGAVAQQNGTNVVLENGELVYKTASTVPTDVAYNTITTPSGRQFQVTLPDGTKVWLNAASSIQYPTAFIGKTRNITITGEVYMEVAQNALIPFFVNINNKAEVQVLGTSFNINAYNNEAYINTTLIEGSIKVIPAAKGNAQQVGVVLQPQEQMQLSNAAISDHSTAHQQKPVINKIQNMQQIIAWKHGLFDFNGATLKEVMNQLARWYAIEIQYPANMPNIVFRGGMDRGANLSQVLEILTEMEIKYALQNRTLMLQN